MYQISDQQIDYILNDIGARGVEMESLQQNLLDHVCCIIENNLEENGDFESFYKKTIKTFYKDELWEIEEETLQLLTYKNYYKMKKVMILSGTFSVIGFIAGSIFKIMHWSGAGALLLLSMATISLVFLPLLFIIKSKELSKRKDKIITALGTVFGILFCLSTLFKIMHWPGANTMWLMALGILMLLFIPIYFFTGIRNPETKINTIITTIILMSAGGMLFALTNLKPNARPLDNTEIEYLSNDEIMIKAEAENIYKLAGKDTTLTKNVTSLKEINKLCDELKSKLLEYEIGYSTITKDLKDKNIVFTVALVNNFFERNKEAVKKLRRINSLIIKNSFECYKEKFRVTKKESFKNSTQFHSTILNYDSDSFYYNNTILGAYKDLCEIQVNAIEDVKELIELKQIKG